MRQSLLIFVTGVAVAALAAGALVFGLYGYPVVPDDVRSWGGLFLLMAVTVGAEVAAIRFLIGRASLSIALIPIVATVPLFGPSVAVAATAASEGVAHFVVKRERIKSVFNTAQFTLAIALGSLVYTALNGPVSSVEFQLGPTIIPFVGLVMVYFVTNTGLVAAVVALDTQKRISNVWREVAPVAFANNLASSSLGLLVVFAFAGLGISGLVIVLLPLIFVHHSYVLYLKLQKQNKEILELLVKTIEAKDPYTSGHSQRVATLSREIAEVLGLQLRRLEEVETAALLHDIGKIDIAYSDLVTSPAELSEAERKVIRSHPERGARLLASISSLSDVVLDAVRHHHEYYGGGGYPDGLAAAQIPIAARIIMVADTVDAMLSDRPYRGALTVGAVRAELRRYSGRQFDPVIVEKFLEAGLVEGAAERAGAKRLPAQVSSSEDMARRVSTL